MSLHKQLWLAIVLLLAVVFSVSIAVTTLSAKHYLEQQLSIKNSDNATALALSLSQQGADEVLMELTLAAQFDTGFYQRIELTAPDGSSTIRRIDDSPATGAPQWFISLLPIDAAPGIAAVQSGWQQAGTLTLQSHSRFAYEELWQSTLRLAAVFLLAGLCAGFIGNRILKHILQPLKAVVEQAEALQQRRYITTPAPATKEFKLLVGAMNSLSAHVKKTLKRDAKRLQQWQRDADVDSVTGLHKREPFLRTLDALLVGEDQNASGSIVILRITNLSLMNRNYGRHLLDSMLNDIGRALHRITLEAGNWSACRLNGSEFALLAPRELDEAALGQRMQGEIADIIESYGLSGECQLPTAALVYQQRDRQWQLLTRLDNALATAEDSPGNELTLAHHGDVNVQSLRDQMQDWRQILASAIAEERFSLELYPVLDAADQLIHQEALVRLRWQGDTLRAGQFLPWIDRLQFSVQLDKQVIDQALSRVRQHDIAIAINLSEDALTEPDFMDWLDQRLISHQEVTPNLCLEVPEEIAFKHFDAFKRLCNRAKREGVQIGIEHVGHQLAQLGKLHDMGLDYLKIDASFVRNVNGNSLNQTLLGTLSTLGHSIGMRVYAEGVESDAERATLMDLGVDGAGGPAIRLPD